MKKANTILLNIAIGLVVLTVSGCYVQLMPTPVVFAQDGIDPFSELPPEDQTTFVDVFYVTNREAKGPMEDRKYTNGMDQVAHVGRSTVQLGHNDISWDDLYKTSRDRIRLSNIPLLLRKNCEYGILEGSMPDSCTPSEELPIGDQKFIDAINAKLDKSDIKEIKIYVHGFNVKFYNSSVFAAQLHHFAVREGVTIAYAWPSRQSLFDYAGDVERAGQSHPHLMALIELLAKHSKAEAINILSYSAGAPIASNALVGLREKYADLNEQQLFETLKVDEVIFASSDIDFRTFVGQFTEFYDLPKKVTITIYYDDPALWFARLLSGHSRLGSADPGELAEDELAELYSHYSEKGNVIDVTYSTDLLGVVRSLGHGFWFNSPWVSSDLLISIYLNLEPHERGLEKVPDKTHSWYFPADYPERIQKIATEIKARQDRIQPEQ